LLKVFYVTYYSLPSSERELFRVQSVHDQDVLFHRTSRKWRIMGGRADKLIPDVPKGLN